MAPTVLTPRRLDDLKREAGEEESKVLSKLDPSRRRLYNKIRRDITEKTEGKFTPAEYHHLTMLYLILDEADAYIETVGGPQAVDPELLNQIRLMRDGLLSRLRDAREEQHTIGSILKDAKEAMIKLKDRRGNEATIIKTDDSASMLSAVEAAMSKPRVVVSEQEKQESESNKET